MTDEQLLELVKAYFNDKDECIKKASFDFENNCVHLTIVPPVSLSRIKIDYVLVDREND